MIKTINWILLAMWLVAIVSLGVSAPARSLGVNLIPLVPLALTLAVAYSNRGPRLAWIALAANALWLLLGLIMLLWTLIGLAGRREYSVDNPALVLAIAVMAFILPTAINIRFLWSRLGITGQIGSAKLSDE